MTPEDQGRSEFESHILSMSLTSLDRFSEGLGGHYRLFSVHQAWLTWQASRRTYRASVLEEAAQVCDKHAENRCDSHESTAIMNCADEIRELAAKTQEGQEP